MLFVDLSSHYLCENHPEEAQKATTSSHILPQLLQAHQQELLVVAEHHASEIWPLAMYV